MGRREHRGVEALTTNASKIILSKYAECVVAEFKALVFLRGILVSMNPKTPRRASKHW